MTPINLDATEETLDRAERGESLGNALNTDDVLIALARTLLARVRELEAESADASIHEREYRAEREYYLRQT